MTQVNGNSGIQPVYGQQQNYGQQPVQNASYNPNVSPYNRPDAYRPQQQGGGGMGSFFDSSQNKPYVTKQSVITAATAAVAGFAIAGPVGAVVGGLIALLASVIMNVISIKKGESQSQQQQAIPAQMTPEQLAERQRQQQLQAQQMQQQAQQTSGQQNTFNPYKK